MALPSNASSFTIIHRAENGEPDFRYSIHDKDKPNMATCVGECIKRCQAMLKKEEVLRAFGSMATSWTKTIPERKDLWYCQGERTNKKMQDVAKNFCEIINNRFPVVFVDTSLHSPHTYGHHWSRKWDGEFEPRHQSICIHGFRADRLLAAASKAARSSSTDSPKSIEYKNFESSFVLVLYHQLGHVFITYLGKGSIGDPVHVISLKSSHTCMHEGEAGRTLEVLTFGGAIVFLANSDEEDERHDCGAAVFKIEDEYRDSVKYEVELPSGVSDFRILRSLGCGYPSDPKFPPTDPLNWEGVADLLLPFLRNEGQQ